LLQIHTLLLREFTALLYKEALLELRQRTALAGLLLYVLGTVLIAAIALRGKVTLEVWNVVYWVIVVFAALQVVARGFMGERDTQQRYLYQLAGPVPLILAKTLYNTIVLTATALVALLLYALLLGYPGASLFDFVLAVLLGSLALACTLTLMSAIASRAGGPATLMAVLSLPLLVPVLLAVLRLGATALAGFFVGRDVLLALGLAGISVALGVVLFPYVWRS